MTYYRGVGRTVERFAQGWIRQTKGQWAGKALQLEPWQSEFLDEFYLVDENRNYAYREALLGVPRKNGKSTLAAAIALHGLLASNEQGAEVYAAAASKEQARIVFDQARDFVEASPKLLDWLTPQRSVITCKATGSVFRVLSSDAPLQHGLNPSLVVMDELWAHKDPELYYALTTGQLARKNPLIISITTAGFDRDSICWDVYSRGRKLAEQGVDAMRKARFLHRWYEAPEGCDVHDREAWALANPSSWIEEEDLALEVERLPEFVFRRLHLNQWTDLEDAWVRPDEWDACGGSPILLPEEESFMGIDVGVRRDSSALVTSQWHGDKLHVKSRIFTPEDMGDTFGVADVREQVGIWAGELGSLREAAFDPWAFRESAEELAERGLPMVQFDQNAGRMAPASEKLYELITEQRLVHDGDPLLRQHVLSAVVQHTDRGWRISKRKSRARIDGCVALAVSADRAVEALIVPPKGKAVAFF